MKTEQTERNVLIWHGAVETQWGSMDRERIHFRLRSWCVGCAGGHAGTRFNQAFQSERRG